jgi:2-iminobutanoate/2-iminopropanoate deaminase
MSTYHAIPNMPTGHPFSLAVAGPELVFISGLGGHHWPSGEISDDVTEQARVGMDELERLLVASGSALSEIVYFRPIATEREHLFAIDAVLRERMPEPRSASAAALICQLADPRMKVEFEAIAHRGAQLVTADGAA